MGYDLLAFIAPWFVHELGHALVALAFGQRLSFRLRLAPWPRGVWTMPNLPASRQAWIAKGGFGINAIVLPVLIRFFPAAAFWYAVGCAVEWWAYPTWNAANDFNFLDSDD
jgi:hypothetical protein